MSHHDPQRRQKGPDLAERIFASQRRKNAVTSRAKDRAGTPPSPVRSPPDIPMHPPASPRSAKPHVTVSRPTPPAEADHEEFSRRLKISHSPSHRNHASKSPKLYNPDSHPTPSRRTAEPENMSDTDSYSRGAGHSAQRQLFNHRKDDPVRFAVLARPSASNLHSRTSPASKSSVDHISTSSASEYAQSSLSSGFTLSSTTDTSSTSSALFEQERKESGNNAFAGELKKLYRSITALEGKIAQEDSETEGSEESGRMVLQTRAGKEVNDEDAEQQRWRKVIADHKRLAEMMHNLLEISLNPSVPTSLRNIPTKYNIIIRLWTHAFHKLLESLRRASFPPHSSPVALEHLQEFIYYAYTFYTGLFEEPTLKSFRGGWLEALGDLARYRMAVAAMVNCPKPSGEALTSAALSSFPSVSPPPSNVDPRDTKSNSTPSARINGSPNPSVGLAAARLLDVEPEKERWRGIAKDWYGAGLADTPVAGKLHHHLGLLCREVEGEEVRGIYHFMKSLTTLHPFATSRESVLPIWSAPMQARRALPDAHVSDLFVLLHGMLFTNIQLDDFLPTLARFIERLEIEGAEEREWTMMAVINITSLLEYGKATSTIKRASGPGGGNGTSGIKVISKRMEEEIRMEIDSDPRGGGNEATKLPLSPSPALSTASSATSAADEYPAAFKLAMQLTFAMLTYVLKHPTLKANAFSRINPYLTVMLTFLVTMCKQGKVLAILERSIPWEELAKFLSGVPRSAMQSQGFDPCDAKATNRGERWAMLTSGVAPPLDEDWCLRGMEWVGRKVYERGFWKSGDDRRAEIEVLDKVETGEVTDGIIEDEDGQDETSPCRNKGALGDSCRRWIRIIRSAIGIASVVDGFRWLEGTRSWVVEGNLKEKVERWNDEDLKEREADERRRMGTRWDDGDAMEVDRDDESGEDSDVGDNDDSDEVKALKARRRYLLGLLNSTAPPIRASRPILHRSQGTRKTMSPSKPLKIVPGYTVLVIDTNILLSSLSALESLVESLCWTVLIPLPVIMELDGLSSNVSPLGEVAAAAASYISSHIRSHSTSLKVQTSKGNYLPSLIVRSEQVDFSTEGDWDRSMDDLILKAAIWQEEHWVDRSALLSGAPERGDTTGAAKVVLMSLDRNLRLKARSRQVPAASEKDLASILHVSR